MKNNSPEKLEIFLWLALRKLSNNELETTVASELKVEENVETVIPDQSVEANSTIKAETSNSSSKLELPLLFNQLNKSELEKLKTLLKDYADKSDAEKENWKKRIRSFIGKDVEFLDKNLHWSHIEEPLKKEPATVQKIIFNALSEKDKEFLKSSVNIETEPPNPANKRNENLRLIEQAVQKSFAKKFTNLKDLQKPTAFDRLNGTQMVRLIRLAGIREVTFACARIEAVETLAAFLKRFPAEAARAIATQLNSLPKTSNERILFAENLVQKALEIEPQPSAMLDLLGIWLIGIRVCESPRNRVSYTQQKLPKEFTPELSKIIEMQCRQTPGELQKEISAEIEQVAETIIKTDRGEIRSPKIRTQ